MTPDERDLSSLLLRLRASPGAYVMRDPERAVGGIGSVLLSGSSWRTKAGWKVGECVVFRQALGVAQHVGWNPVGEVLLQDAVSPGRCVLLTDRREPVNRKTAATRTKAHQTRRWTSVTFPFTSLVRTTSGESARALIASKIA